MTVVIAALVPVFLLIVTSFLLRRWLIQQTLIGSASSGSSIT